MIFVWKVRSYKHAFYWRFASIRGNYTLAVGGVLSGGFCCGGVLTPFWGKPFWAQCVLVLYLCGTISYRKFWKHGIFVFLCFSSTLRPLPVYQNTYSLTCCFPFNYHVASCKNFFKHHNITESILGGRAIARLSGDGRQDCRGHRRRKCVQRARGLGISENSL